MRRAFRPPTTIAPTERLAHAIAALPPRATAAQEEVAERDDLPLVAGSWHGGAGGCLVANVLAATATTAATTATAPAATGPAAPGADAGEHEAETLDVRMLADFPELSSRDLNRLIVAWDEAAAEAVADDDAALRLLLRDALALAAARSAAQPLAGGGLGTCG